MTDWGRGAGSGGRQSHVAEAPPIVDSAARRRAFPTPDPRPLAPILVLAVCAIVLHRDGLFGGPAFYERDTQLFYYPLAQWVGEQLRAGSYPLWLPGTFTGYPIFADGELGLLYLPQIVLLFALPGPLAIVWLRVVHAFLAGVFTLWFLRSLRLGPGAALGGALVFAFGSFLTAQMHHENVVRSAVWLPAVLACYEHSQRAAHWRRSVGWLALGALAFAQSALGLHVQPVLMSTLAIAAYAVFKAVVHSRRARWAMAAAAGLGAGGVALAAAQLLPLGEWALVSSRRGGVDYEFGSAFGLAPENLATVLFPFFFRLTDGVTWWSLWQQWETELYVGVPTLALLVLGIVFARRIEVIYFVVLGVVALLIGMAHYAPLVNLHLVLWSIPGFSFLRAPGRFSYLVVFACACLAAFGLEVLLARRMRLVIALSGALPPIGLLAALLALLPSWRGWLEADPARARAFVESTYLAARAQYPIDPQLVVTGLLASLDLSNLKTAWTLALLLLTALGFVAWLELGRRHAVLGQSVLVGLIAVDLLVFASDFHPKMPLASLVPELPQGVSAGQRVLLYSPPDLPRFEPNQLLTSGVAAVEGYSSLPSQRHVEVYAETVQQPALFDLWAAQTIIEPIGPPDARSVNGVSFRTQHPLLAGFGGAAPSVLRVPADVGPVSAVRIVGTLSYAFNVPQGTSVATLVFGDQSVPLRAGIELAERAYDRPSLRGMVQHARPTVALDFEEATPQGEAYTAHLYQAELPLSPGAARTITMTPTDPAVLVQLYGVALVTSTGTRSLELVDRDGLRRVSPMVLTNDRALARAFTLPRSQSFSPARHPGLTATQLVASPDVDVHRQVLVENDPSAPAEPGSSTAEAAPARLVELGPNGVQVIANVEVPSYLIVTDFYHRGWTAYVDGRPSRVYIADALFRAVSIEPGQHVVELRFEPLSHLLGALISALTLLADLALIAWGMRNR